MLCQGANIYLGISPHPVSSLELPFLFSHWLQTRDKELIVWPKVRSVTAPKRQEDDILNFWLWFSTPWDHFCCTCLLSCAGYKI